MKLPSIYGLCDPHTGVIRYVGKSNNPKRRLAVHLCDRSGRHLACWIRKLKPHAPVLIILETDCADWQAAERRWIAELRASGLDLLNHTDGGEGLANPTDEIRAKLSRIRRAKWADPIERERMLEVLRSPERRRKISKALSGRPRLAEHVAKLPQNRPGRKGPPKTETWKAALAASQRRRWAIKKGIGQ